MNIGDKAPEILGLNEKGEEIRLSNYKGKKPRPRLIGCKPGLLRRPKKRNGTQ